MILRKRIILFLSISFLVIIAFSCTSEVHDNSLAEEFNNDKLKCVFDNLHPQLTIHEGILSQKEDTFRIIRNDKCVGIVKLGEPVALAQAKNQEGWGYFQFPIIYRNENNHLIVKYQMRADSQADYGKNLYEYRMSLDEGRTWVPLDKEYFIKERYRIEMRNGDVLQVKDMPSFDRNLFADFPKPVNECPLFGYDFYRENELPDKVQGVYFDYWTKSRAEGAVTHSYIEDNNYLRYSLDNYMPIVWWGDIKQIDDESLVAGVYPCYYQNSKGEVQKSGVSFYKSTDRGKYWRLIGTIPCYREDPNFSYVFDSTEGFSEPAFEILKDGTYFCVMRTGYFSPMYKSFSYDNGSHWTTPEPFTPNGVMPNLLLLKNGVIILASGRPGIQLRFCLDGDGKSWTDPIDLLPFINEDGNIDIWGRTCGYPSILVNDDNSFFIVYSDFQRKNIYGENMKTILFRKVELAVRR